jgi:hypothetical protein
VGLGELARLAGEREVGRNGVTEEVREGGKGVRSTGVVDDVPHATWSEAGI